MNPKQDPQRSRPSEGGSAKKETAPGGAKEREKRNGPESQSRSRDTGAETSRGERPVWRAFPGPGHPTVALRVTLSREAYADIALHARESLDAEICGVLAGDVCEDEAGMFVHAYAALQGTAARQGATHVTFTHETWDLIHRRLETELPGARIVGWYHSHPGFGVEFSEMDLFIQRNFFPAQYQIALVTDPLGGETAVCVQEGAGITYLDRIWVEGKEVRCVVPRGQMRDKAAGAGGKASGGAGGGGSLADSGALAEVVDGLRQMETRLQQLLQSVEDQRNALYRFLVIVGLFVGVIVVGSFGYNMYVAMTTRAEPPKALQYVPVPVQVGNDTILLGVAVTSWKVPESLNLVERLKKEARKSVEEEMMERQKQEGGQATPAPETPEGGR